MGNGPVFTRVRGAVYSLLRGRATTRRMKGQTMLRIESVNPTVLFKNSDAGLLQAVDVTIKNTSASPSVGATITFAFPGADPVVCDLPELAPKTSTQRVMVPDCREPADVVVTLVPVRGKGDEQTIAWAPRKHWDIHFVPIAHHDYGYTDPIEDILYFFKDLYNKVADYCEATADYPDEAKFHYTCEEAWSLRYFVEHSDDAAIDRLAKYVAEGRVEIPALLGNETSGICSHEELVRLTYPSRVLQERLGGEICTGSITDVPGLSWGLPTVLAGAGVKYFFAGLPPYFNLNSENAYTNWDEASIMRDHGQPDAFWWEGPDGSKVLVYYQGGYGGIVSPTTTDEVMENLPSVLAKMDDAGNPFSAFRVASYGCGDNTQTSMIGCDVAREWNDEWAFPRMMISTNTKFFQAIEPQCEDLRTLRGELPHSDYAVGAVSTAKETSLNRLTHDKLPAIERFATIAGVTDARLHDPMSGHFHANFLMKLDEPEMHMDHRLENAWYDMMMFDEHTWGMWSPVGSIHDFNWHDKARHAYRAAGTTTMLSRRILDSIAKGVKREEGHHIVVFNQLSTDRTDIVRVSGMEADHLWILNELKQDKEPFTLTDLSTGKPVAYQLVDIDSPQATVPYAAGRYGMGQLQPTLKLELHFKAEDVPSVGYKTFRMEPAKDKPSFESSLTVSTSGLENEFFKIVVDSKTGAIESIFDKELGRELADADAPHSMNQLVVKHAKTCRLKTPTRTKVTVGQTGPIYASLLITSQALGCPQVTQEIVLHAGVKRVDFNNRVLKDSTPLLELYIAFPFKADDPNFTLEGSNSVIRPFVDQLPGSNTNYYSVQHWANMADGDASVTLAPIDAHLVEFGGMHPFHTSPAHRNVEPKDFKNGFVAEEAISTGHMYSFIAATNFCTNFTPAQQGDLLFRYSLTSGKGDWTTGAPRDFGWATGNPLMPVMVHLHTEGDRPVSDSFCQIDQPNVVLTSLKRADDGDGMILRLTETEGQATDVKVDLPFLEISSALATDLVERNAGAIASEAHSVTVPMKPFGIATVRLRM
jgi:alpha-mannosidase